MGTVVLGLVALVFIGSVLLMFLGPARFRMVSFFVAVFTGFVSIVLAGVLSTTIVDNSFYIIMPLWKWMG